MKTESAVQLKGGASGNTAEIHSILVFEFENIRF
jgi:hypothetical protein